MTDTQSPKPKVRWKIITVWITLLTVIFLYFYISHEGKDRTMQAFAFLIYITVSGISILVWWYLFSGLPIRMKVQGLGVPLLFCLLFRCDGFNGDVLPIVKPRWSPKPDLNLSDVEVAKSDVNQLSFDGYQLGETDWPDFRGVGRAGVAKEANFDSSWLSPKEEWKITIGAGWASFISVRDMCWTLEQLDNMEAVTAYDVKTGKKIWQRTFTEKFDETFGGPGPRTSPVFENGRIWTLGGTGLLNCFDAATGTPFWKVNILENNNAENIEWGMSATPLIYKDLIITLPGGQKGNSLVAYDKMTGEKRWSGGNSIASYSSPQLSIIDGVEQIVVHNGVGVSSHSPEDGKVLWDYPWTTASKVNVAQPVIYDGNKVILSSGYTVGSVCLEVSQKDGDWKVSQKWKSRRLKAKFNALVAKDKYLYGLDEGILTCLDMDTGDRVWKGGRYGYGQMILAGDTIVILSEKGEVVFVKAHPDQHDEIGKFPAIKGKTWQHPIIANGRLIVRNDREAACFLLNP